MDFITSDIKKLYGNYSQSRLCNYLLILISGYLKSYEAFQLNFHSVILAVWLDFVGRFSYTEKRGL